MTTEEILTRMSKYQLYEEILDTPGLSKLFNELAVKAREADKAVAAEREAWIETSGKKLGM